MCGIVGYVRLSSSAPMVNRVAATRALDILSHRGPDGSGEWSSPDGSCWLGHRRLAIIDLHTGRQPMSNEDGSVWVSFNGEIYNYQELRRELVALGHVFHTHSDTEVLVHGYESWGASALAKRLQGIFAFAVYDCKNQSVALCRDHTGVKPLYWWCDGGLLVFASEMKALLCFPEISAAKKVYRPGIAQYIVTRYVSRPDSMFEGIMKLPEGYVMEASRERATPRMRRYWDVRYMQRPISEEDALSELDLLLKKTISKQLMSDVPLGIQLSGGVDSSMILALTETIRRESGYAKPIKTFGVGFDIPEFSELPHARRVADRYGSDHHEVVIDSHGLMGDLARMCWFYDEPMGEPAAIPTYYMCKAAKQHVTVMLTGEGADEQFGGYSKYVLDSFSHMLEWVPDGIRRKGLRWLGTAMPFKARRFRVLFETLGLASDVQRYASWAGGFDSVLQQELLHPAFRKEIGDGGLMSRFSGIMNECESASDRLHRFLYCDIHTRMVDNNLVKGDRMSMAAGIESRVPFLDHRVIEFAASLQGAHKVNGLHQKVLLKTLAQRYLPHENIYRRKVGFTVPLTRWFGGSMRGLITHVLLSDRFASRGYFDQKVVKKIVSEHLEHKVDREPGIWLLLTLELWHRIFIDDDGSEAAAGRLAECLAPYTNRKPEFSNG